MVRSIFALAAVLSLATASLARDLVTPAVYVGPSTSVACKLLNITSAPVPARVQMIADGGASPTAILESLDSNPGSDRVFSPGSSGLRGVERQEFSHHAR